METAVKQVSSMMEEPEYNPATRILTIHFKHGNAVHHYRDFSPADFEAFHSASSWGRHFHQHIKPRYEGQETRLGSPGQEPS